MNIKDISKDIHENAKAKGFWEDDRNLGEMLMLIVSEVSEALEADRADRYCNANMKLVNHWEDDIEFAEYFHDTVKNTFEDELADIIIRVLDLAYSKGIDIEAHIKAKHRYNTTRSNRHGKKY